MTRRKSIGVLGTDGVHGVSGESEGYETADKLDTRRTRDERGFRGEHEKESMKWFLSDFRAFGIQIDKFTMSSSVYKHDGRN